MGIAPSFAPFAKFSGAISIRQYRRTHTGPRIDRRAGRGVERPQRRRAALPAFVTRGARLMPDDPVSRLAVYQADFGRGFARDHADLTAAVASVLSYPI